MVRVESSTGRGISNPDLNPTTSAKRRLLRSQASRLVLLSAIGLVATSGASLLSPEQAQAACLVGATTVTCDTTVTTDTTFPANAPLDRNYVGLLPVPVILNISAGAAVSGNGLAVSNTGNGGVTITNNGSISVDAGNTPTAGGTAALSVAAAGGPIIYTGGDITNNGAGNAFNATQTAGAGSINITLSGGVVAAAGAGVVVRDVATSTGISVTTGAVTALTAGQNGIDVQSQSLTGDVTEVANGAVQAGNAGMVAAIFPAAATGDIDVTANGAITARFGVDAENFGTGSTSVTTVGPVNVTSGNGVFALATGGAVTVNAGDVTSTGNTAIIAQQTSAAGAGAVSVTAGAVSGTTGIVVNNVGTGATSVVANGAVTGTAANGIVANGNGAITVTNGGAVTGATNGILTNETGGGVTTFNVNGSVTGNGAGLAAINTATTGAGLIDINVANGVSVSGANGSAIRTSTNGGVVSLDLGTGGAGAPTTTISGLGTDATSWVLDLNNSGASTTTVNIASNTVVRSTGAATARYGDRAIRGDGGSVVLNNGGRLEGRVDFSALTGNVVLNNTSNLSWHTTGLSTFSPGADTLNNSGTIFTNAGGVATSWDFLGGNDTFANSGTLVVGEPALAASTLTITGLEAWNNSGSIIFGSAGSTASDGQTNDAIFANGTTFTGSGGSRLVMDVNLGAVAQTSCAVLAAADCLSLVNGTTAGSTTIRVNDTGGGGGAYNPTGIVLVDVSGTGSTADSHFSLLAGQPLWRADPSSADGVLDKGLFFYDLTTNANKQHVLVGLPDGNAFEFMVTGTAAQNAWYQTTGSWYDRQADLRDQLGDIDGSGAGVWVKIAGGATSRDLTNSYDVLGTTYTFDTSYNQDTISLMGGVDFISANAGDRQWVVGGMIGYIDTNVDFDASNTMIAMDGLTVGLYGTYVAKNFFVDGIIAGNFLDVVHQAPSMAPAPNNRFTSEANSVGGQIEGGYTIALGENAFFEPLASLSYVKTSFDDITVPGAVIMYDDQKSLRGSLGARVGVNHDFDRFTSKFTITARIWDELEGENGLVIDSVGPDLPLTDDFSGSFGEVSGSVNVFSNEAAFSAFVNAGVKFKDDYQSTDASLGFRWRW